MSKKILFTPQVITPQKLFEIEELMDITQDWDNRWRRMGVGDTKVRLSIYNTPRLQFSSFEYNNAIFIEGSHPKGTIMLSIIDSNDTISFANQKLLPYELIVLKYGEEVDYLARTNNTIFTLTIEEKLFLNSFERYFGQEIDKVRANGRLVVDRLAKEIVIQNILYWLKYFQNYQNSMDIDILYHIENEILETIFTSIEFRERKASKSRLDISKVREVMHDNIQNIYTIGDLAQELKISPRTLQYNFKMRIGFTPKEYLHQLRLNAIREELISSMGECRVSDIALKYGFFNSSHFSAEYKRVFKETPSDTLK